LIYLGTSVVLARLLAEDRSPPDVLWSQTLLASRLLEFEIFNRLHALDAAGSHGKDARLLLERIHLVEMTAAVLGRGMLPFVRPIRTLDALHLATMSFLRGQGLETALATYDLRMAAGAVGEGFALADC
jgi:hypothetical protein